MKDLLNEKEDKIQALEVANFLILPSELLYF